MVHTSKDIPVSTNGYLRTSLHGPVLFLYLHLCFLYGPVPASERASKFWSSIEYLLILLG